MPILEEEKNKFFNFIDSILKKGSIELEQNNKKDNVSKNEISSDLFKEGGVKGMADEKKMEELEKKLQELSEAFANDKKIMEEAHKTSLAEVEKKLSDAHAKEVEATNKKLEDAEKKLAERDSDLRKEKVNKTCDDLISKGFWPSVIEKAKKVMLEDAEGKFASIKLEDKEMSLSEIIVDMLEAIPSDVRVSLEELSHLNKNTDPNKKFMSDAEVEQYAKDNSMSYQDACSVLAKEGKIEL